MTSRAMLCVGVLLAALGHANPVPDEILTKPVAGKQPHILMVLFDDYGWADAGWHRNYTAPGGAKVPATDEVQTPHLNELVSSGIELNRNYIYKYCSPTRSALQSGRNPYHVNPLNAAPAPVTAAKIKFVSGKNAMPALLAGVSVPREMIPGRYGGLVEDDSVLPCPGYKERMGPAAGGGGNHGGGAAEGAGPGLGGEGKQNGGGGDDETGKAAGKVDDSGAGIAV
eukprot:g4791.t1